MVFSQSHHFLLVQILHISNDVLGECQRKMVINVDHEGHGDEGFDYHLNIWLFREGVY